jgi:hypothetical protein
MYMSQLNINLDPVFERNLKLLLAATKHKHKSALIKKLVADAVQALGLPQKNRDFTRLLGLAKIPAAEASRKYLSEDDLW